mgnify:CR=1 FL=1
MADVPQIFEQTVAKIGAPDHVLEHVNMFGKPSAKLPDGKPFLSFFQDCMVFKLTAEAHGRALGLDGALLFDPSGKGRPMREWVQVPEHHVAAWPELAVAARDYVANLG